ncbi:hypothetical protein BIW11_10492 [Tropilaelaps mercedesae]|uniref:Uncharacterized protein n=1 Tax=Tropilaelaps mercedesae TaxID=418985 RepID=A0A1V9XFU5_9ACAR|nr:hypothetical protein BIW11_10492 [Tropilaelaps mercedesae]
MSVDAKRQRTAAAAANSHWPTTPSPEEASSWKVGVRRPQRFIGVPTTITQIKVTPIESLATLHHSHFHNEPSSLDCANSPCESRRRPSWSAQPFRLVIAAIAHQVDEPLIRTSREGHNRETREDDDD